MYFCFLSAAFFMINVPFIHLDFNLISQQLESIKSGGDVEAWRTGFRLLLLLSFSIVFVYALRKACSIITRRLCSTTSVLCCPPLRLLTVVSAQRENPSWCVYLTLKPGPCHFLHL